MLDELERAIIAVFKWRERTALAFAQYLFMLIDRIPEPARKYLPLPKSEHPETYETVEPGRYD
jgi:hypothetical protein